LASGAVNNALWDMYARSRRKPLWQLIVDMTPEEIVRSATFRYISDVITKEEAIAMLKEKKAGALGREQKVRELG
jgi:L-fuconate dehydratase